jgi:hypothetical protein
MGKNEALPPGITEPDLLAVCVGPDLDSTTAQACLKELKEQCLYLHFDGVRYCFKKDPNVTLLIEQETESVARDEGRVRGKVKRMGRFVGQRPEWKKAWVRLAPGSKEIEFFDAG